MKRGLLAALVGLVLLGALAGGLPLARGSDVATAPVTPDEAMPAAWPSDVLDLVAAIPLQAEGRVKPLQTWSRYTLLRLNHRATVQDAWGRTQGPIGWLLDALLRPAVARRAPCFLVPDDEVLQAIGLARLDTKKKRDRYTYEDLLPARDALRALGADYAHREAADRTRVETYVMELAHDVALYEGLMGYLDFAAVREGKVPTGGELAALFGGREAVGALEVLARADEVVAVARRVPDGALDPESPTSRALEGLTRAVRGSRTLALVPPLDPADETWRTPFDLASDAFLGGAYPSPAQIGILQALEAAATNPADTGAVRQAVRAWHDGAVSLARARGEYDKVPLEVALVRWAPFAWALRLYLLAFVLLAVSWLKPSPWLLRGAAGAVLAALLLHAGGIVVRCVLRDRPPVSTLYETVLFVTWVMVAACLFVERLDRRRVALALAPVIGALGLFLADRYEVLKGEDTMPQLVAVLDTNFWLTVHVLCIGIGYAGSLLASAVAHVHVVRGVFGRQGDLDRALARMVYGTLCFALFFTLVGTILGGVWANESWGRFWGWDPKENGALMIVLAQLGILHARMGGLLKSFGISLATIVAGVVTAFSWWGVNLLGIGLHSYGHTTGVARALDIFYAVELVFVVAGGVAWARARPRVCSRP
ncbi:MAG: cytochrome c biogenesis protein [Planctomycetota bacterium]